MIIILKKDGTVVTDDGNHVEGVKLENAAAILADPKDGDTIVYDATAGMWVAGTGGGSFEPDITNPQDGDTLVYDASEEKWVNGSGGGSGGAFVANVVFGDSDTHLDKTVAEIKAAMEAGSQIYLKQDNSFNSAEYGYTAYFLCGLKSFDEKIYTGSETDKSSTYTIIFHDENNGYIANSLTDYPVLAN